MEITSISDAENPSTARPTSRPRGAQGGHQEESAGRSHHRRPTDPLARDARAATKGAFRSPKISQGQPALGRSESKAPQLETILDNRHQKQCTPRRLRNKGPGSIRIVTHIGVDQDDTDRLFQEWSSLLNPPDNGGPDRQGIFGQRVSRGLINPRGRLLRPGPVFPSQARLPRPPP